MASNHTSNYNLNQWSADDRVLRTDFNADNAKIDAAIAAVDRQISALSESTASAAELANLKRAVDILKTTVSHQSAVLTGKGNCQLYTTSYTGRGEFGESTPCSVQFPQKPAVVFITGPGGIQGILCYGQPLCYVGRFGVGGNYIVLNWSGNNLSWYSNVSPAAQLNTAGETYSVTALLQAD